jgi:hypothetical protein
MQTPLLPSFAPDPPALRRDRLIGLSIVGSAFVAALGISVWAKVESRPETSPPPAPATTVGVVGYPKKVDAIKTLAAARTVTKRPHLRGIVAQGVMSDGTVDLSEGPGDVRYSFQSEAGQGAQPQVDPSARPRRRYCGLQRVVLRREGMVAEPDLAHQPCPSQHTDALPEPRCSLKDVWQRALSRGAPKERTARIEYYRSKVGPAWRFDMPGTPYRFSVYGDCGRELTPSEAIGYVP